MKLRCETATWRKWVGVLEFSLSVGFLRLVFPDAFYSLPTISGLSQSLGMACFRGNGEIKRRNRYVEE